jgi:hypothetical protein
MLGGPTPYALRPTDSDEFLFCGECFVYGVMHGEAIPLPARIMHFSALASLGAKNITKILCICYFGLYMRF